LNGTSGILLACGYAAIRKSKVQIHKRFMISAFAVSTVFLFSYLLYHYRVGHVPFHDKAGSAPSISCC
jgi:putative membrane protein